MVLLGELKKKMDTHFDILFQDLTALGVEATAVGVAEVSAKC